MYYLKSLQKLSVLLLGCCLLHCVAPKNEHEATIQQYFTFFNEHNWEKMAGLYTDSALFKDPDMGYGGKIMSKEAIVAKYTELAAMFPNVKDSVTAIYSDNAKQAVTVEFISTGTDSSGMGFKLPICTVFTFEKGKIKEDFTYYTNGPCN
jgi:predicted SnoaL-like aldol condensation-catalyzing enzyme